VTKPISPDEVVGKKTQLIPDYVFEAFNEMIAKNWNGSSATIKITEAIAGVLSHAPQGVTKELLFDNNYLDIEHSYQEVGWKVEFDKPGYNETYEAKYRFYKKRRDS
jgi:hypothetical protein